MQLYSTKAHTRLKLGDAHMHQYKLDIVPHMLPQTT